MKKTFGEKFKFALRKMMISLKRNYYIIPLIFVFAVCGQFMLELYILSPGFSRIDASKMASLIIFVVTLLTTLACVAYLNYALVKYGQKRPLYMLIIYYVLWAIVLAMTILLIKDNLENMAEEIAAREAAEAGSAQWEVNNTAVVNAQRCNRILIVNVVLQAITFVLVTTAPFVQKALKKITFKSIGGTNE